MKPILASLLVALLLISPAALAGAPEGSWLAQAEKMAAEKEVKAKEAAATRPQGDGPPLPLHTLEGVGGALAVPEAYLVNPGPQGTILGKPAFSATFIGLGTKNILGFAVTETLFRRIELGYALNRFDLGNLPHVATNLTRGAVHVSRHNVLLHHFNARVQVIEENTPLCGIPLPAVTAGAQFKYNGDIQQIDEDTFGGFHSVGLERANGIDYVLTATKMFPKLMFGRPLVLTAGVRNSQASNFGYTGFADHCATTVEADAVTLVTDWLAVGYEFRQRSNPYDTIPGLLGDETNFHAIRTAIIINENLAVAFAWAFLGPVGNSNVDCAWGVQIKYEF